MVCLNFDDVEFEDAEFNGKSQLDNWQ